MLFNQISMKSIVASGDRSVSSEDNLPWHLMSGGVKFQTFLLHAITNRLQDAERTMTFVEVQNPRCYSQRFESTEAPDTQEQLLTNARAPIPAVETRGQVQIFGSIAGHIRIKEQQVAAPHTDTPDLGPDWSTAGLDLYHDGFAVFADGNLHGKLGDVVMEILLVLPSLFIQVLAEVALAIEQADADEGYT